MWRSCNCEGWMGFVLKEKLKLLKFHLKEWHKGEYGGMDGRLEILVEAIADLDVKGEGSVLSGEEVQRRKDMFGEMWRILKAKRALMVQRSRSKWMREGDANSKFFHRCVKLRSNKNIIKALKVNDGWVESPYEVRKAVVDYFTEHVSTTYWDRPKLDGVTFNTLSEGENGRLVAPFTMLEIELVVRESDGNKSPGPDGFNFAFVKEFLYLMKNEVRIMFDQFHANEVVPKSILSYFVALIPKVSSPLALKDFRPIS
jgi:hypothetical protein